ncbi:MAG: hypothetical protein LBT98_00505 [Puniceicoccales bacterium]|jgi:hypothetical protein|nr:hypothetical protein [Puniceicoccales bacterium]
MSQNSINAGQAFLRGFTFANFPGVGHAPPPPQVLAEVTTPTIGLKDLSTTPTQARPPEGASAEEASPFNWAVLAWGVGRFLAGLLTIATIGLYPLIYGLVADPLDKNDPEQGEVRQNTEK